jgi:hypothetical protein
LTEKETKIQLAGDELFIALSRASRGLIYVSEIDAEIEPILVCSPGELSMNQLVKRRLSGGNQPVETTTAAEFFDRLITDQDWHSEAEIKKVRRFRRLKKIIFDNLCDVRLIRAGRVQIDIYVLGYDQSGNIAGIVTRSVET